MKKINKIIGMFGLMILLFVSSVSATQIYIADNGVFPTIPNTFTNQIYKYKQSVLGNETNSVDILRNIIFQNPYKTLITVQTLNNDNITHEYKLWANSLTGGVTILSQNFSLTPNNQNLLGIFSSVDNEEVDIYLKCIDCVGVYSPFDVTYTLIEQTEDSLNTAFSPLITGVVSLIEININIWKIVYYMIITGLVVGFVGFIFFIAFSLFKFGNRMKEKKHRLVEVFDRAGEDRTDKKEKK